MASLKDIREETQFVQNILRKEAHLAGPKKDRPDLAASRRFKKAKAAKARGGADVNKRPGILTRLRRKFQ